ncbi:uncharacterized protein LAESUDRAFT_659661 [Laetiporus sulphureus 93-53]|uniref:RlpA-like protein double-psi beta-barrel domain-containing protein n=1 Tax=Laetiporus sulphureus 93-53 TaxID=1314785 RepID=A0A165CV62_9APHY|nr:uncharacterized protein LAESUDRAFT_659661 [Laetiporus sulphureus 93-53]KZT03485.1 hypothetical protein LAESUDRAFT_659661 [Laetiporus sulphureus 93-53]
MSYEQARGLNPSLDFDNARLSFFDAGQNACGSVDTDSDFIVALNIEQWDGGAHCYQTITINYNDKSTQATITDECPGCPYGGLDLSRGLFDFFADEAEGILYGTWNFGNGAPSPSNSRSPSPTPMPTSSSRSSSAYVYKPTSTYTPPPPPTPTYSPPLPSYTASASYSTYLAFSSFWPNSTFSSFTPNSTFSSFSSTSTPSSTTAGPTPSATPVNTISFDQGSLNQFNLAIVGLSGLVEAANWT